MSLKVGMRVTVRPLPNGDPQKHCEGKRGEIVQIGSKGGITVVGENLVADVPQTDESLVLVDDQYVNGKPVGISKFREWFRAEELEPG